MIPRHGVKGKALKHEEEVRLDEPDFLKDICSECGKSVSDMTSIPVAKRNCKTCVLRFFTKNDGKGRDHNWNLKVKVQVVGYNCLDCTLHVKSLKDVKKDCPGKIDIPEVITGIPFKPSEVNSAIHPPKFVPINERVKAVQEAKKKCVNVDCLKQSREYHAIGDGILCGTVPKPSKPKVKKQNFKSLEEDMPEWMK